MEASWTPYRVQVAPEFAALPQGWKAVDAQELWLEDIASLPGHITSQLPALEWRWALLDWEATAVKVPNQPWFHHVLTSRNYPVITVTEQALIRHARVVIAGLSVGRSVATQLARLGVEHFALADGDVLAPANFNRLHGSTIRELGLSKVESVAREILEINPYAEVQGLIGKLDAERLEDVIARNGCDIVIEVVDDTRAKVELRLVAHSHGIPLLMPTDVDWDPMVDIELPTLPMFDGRLAPQEVEALTTNDITFEEKTALVMRMMGLQKWAPRSFAGGVLARQGKVRFWPQIGPCAAATAALTVRAVFEVMRGSAGLPARAVTSLRDPFMTNDPLDDDDPLMAGLSNSIET
jgi:hypothetical protein